MAWSDLEQLIIDTTVDLVQEHVRGHRDETLYVVGLHEVFRELDGVITLPIVGVNSVEALATDHPDDEALGFWAAKWDPQRWRWPDISRLDARLVVAERQLLRLATRGSSDRWLKTEARFWTTMARATRRIHGELAGTSGVSADLVVLLHDRNGGPKLARRGMGERAFQEHFPEHGVRKRERRRVAALPVDDQVDYLIGRLGQHDRNGLDSAESADRLRTIGAPAIDPLLALLPDVELGWQAAMLLGQIGIPADGVVTALRDQVGSSRLVSQRAWCASALAFLGDATFLVDRAGDLPPALVTTGVTAPLSPFRDQCLRPAVLDYGPVEQLIDRSPDYAILVEDEIDPRNGVCTISSAEVDLVLLGLSSPHRAIRRHAAAAIEGPHLNRAASERVVQALTARITDVDTAVRRAAALSLRSWTRP